MTRRKKASGDQLFLQLIFLDAFLFFTYTYEKQKNKKKKGEETVKDNNEVVRYGVRETPREPLDDMVDVFNRASYGDSGDNGRDWRQGHENQQGQYRESQKKPQPSNQEVSEEAFTITTKRGETIWQGKKLFASLPWSFTYYRLTSEKLYIKRGLLNTKYDELLLYRVTDIHLERNILQRLWWDTGTIVLCTAADHAVKVPLLNIKDSERVKDVLAVLVEKARKDNNVVGREFFSSRAGSDAQHGW